MKCQVCRHADAEWSWQPFGPDENPLSFALIGSHYRGFPVVKVCDFCKREAIENCVETGTPVRFTLKETEYVFDGAQPPYNPHLWDGGTSGESGGQDFTMLCRYTPTSHDIVAHVFDKALAEAIMDAYNEHNKASRALRIDTTNVQIMPAKGRWSGKTYTRPDFPVDPTDYPQQLSSVPEGEIERVLLALDGTDAPVLEAACEKVNAWLTWLVNSRR